MIKIEGENGLIVGCLISAISKEFKINKKSSLKLLCMALDTEIIQDVLEEKMTELIQRYSIGEQPI